MRYSLRTMALSAADKCPHCGTPFMSNLAPGEDPASRYCYTCETTAGGVQMAATLEAAGQGAELGDELALIPNAPGAHDSGPRRGRMAPARRPNLRPAPKRPSGTFSAAG